MDKKVKYRPDNGPGANGLRGGKNVYSTKTTIGNWQDAVGGAGLFKRGFSTDDFETEGQHQQKGALQKEEPYFGSGVPMLETLRIEPFTTFDIFKPIDEKKSPVDVKDHFKSNARYTQETGLIKKSDLIVNKNISRDKLEQYRNEWTTDTVTSRTMRFKTENRIAGNAIGAPFTTVSVRKLPGTPRSLETYREKMVERHGCLALSCLRHYVRTASYNDAQSGGNGNISADALKAALAKTEVKIIPADFYQILAYFTPTNILNSEQFIRTVVARVDGFDKTIALDMYKAYCADCGTSILSVSDVTGKIDRSSHPEVAEGLCTYLPAYAYSSDGGYVSEESFVEMLNDIYCSQSSVFKTVISTLFL